MFMADRQDKIAIHCAGMNSATQIEPGVREHMTSVEFVKNNAGNNFIFSCHTDLPWTPSKFA
jgi:hypothetical protein